MNGFRPCCIEAFALLIPLEDEWPRKHETRLRMSLCRTIYPAKIWYPIIEKENKGPRQTSGKLSVVEIDGCFPAQTDGRRLHCIAIGGPKRKPASKDRSILGKGTGKFLCNWWVWVLGNRASQPIYSAWTKIYGQFILWTEKKKMNGRRLLVGGVNFSWPEVECGQSALRNSNRGFSGLIIGTPTELFFEDFQEYPFNSDKIDCG